MLGCWGLAVLGGLLRAHETTARSEDLTFLGAARNILLSPVPAAPVPARLLEH